MPSLSYPLASGGTVHIVDWLRGRLADPATLLLVLDPAIRTTVTPQQVQLFTSIAALCLQADPDLRYVIYGSV